jgi:phage terminase large subunit-like protein
VDYTPFLAAHGPIRAEVERFARFCSVVGIELEDFQRLVVAEVFSGRREVLTLVPRKNGKTTLIACLVLWHLLTVAEPWVIAAASNHQAGQPRC